MLPELAAEIAQAVLRAALAAFEHVLLDGLTLTLTLTVILILILILILTLTSP